MKNKKSFFWTQEDLCLLWIGFQARFKSEKISQNLGRSCASINKSIRRHKIFDLPKLKNAEKIWKEMISSSSQNDFSDLCKLLMIENGVEFQNVKWEKSLYSQKKTSSHYERPRMPMEEWGKWGDVIRNLNSYGIRVHKNTRTLCNNSEFLVENRPSNRMQLLLMMNKIRIELCLPPLYIDGLTT